MPTYTLFSAADTRVAAMQFNGAAFQSYLGAMNDAANAATLAVTLAHNDQENALSQIATLDPSQWNSPLLPPGAAAIAINALKMSQLQIRVGPPSTQAVVQPNLSGAGAMITVPWQITVPADSTATAADVSAKLNQLFASLRLGLGRLT